MLKRKTQRSLSNSDAPYGFICMVKHAKTNEAVKVALALNALCDYFFNPPTASVRRSVHRQSLILDLFS